MWKYFDQKMSMCLLFYFYFHANVEYYSTNLLPNTRPPEMAKQFLEYPLHNGPIVTPTEFSKLD